METLTIVFLIWAIVATMFTLAFAMGAVISSGNADWDKMKRRDAEKLVEDLEAEQEEAEEEQEEQEELEERLVRAVSIGKLAIDRNLGLIKLLREREEVIDGLDDLSVELRSAFNELDEENDELFAMLEEDRVDYELLVEQYVGVCNELHDTQRLYHDAQKRLVMIGQAAIDNAANKGDSND